MRRVSITTAPPSFLPSFLPSSPLLVFNALARSRLSVTFTLGPLCVRDQSDRCPKEQKGITQQTVKEIVDELVSDGIINMDKM